MRSRREQRDAGEPFVARRWRDRGTGLTWTEWRDGDLYLPRADRVMFTADFGRRVLGVADWELVFAALGAKMKRDDRFDPPMWRVRGLPRRSVLRVLTAAA